MHCLELLGEGPSEEEEGEGNGSDMPESLNLAPIRQKGRHEAGYKHLANMQTTNAAGTTAFEVTGNTYMEEEETTAGNLEEEMIQVPPKKKDLVAILGYQEFKTHLQFC